MICSDMINLQLTSIEKRPSVEFNTKFKYFIPKTYKIGLLFRSFSLCSDFIKFNHEIDKLKSFYMISLRLAYNQRTQCPSLFFLGLKESFVL